MIYLQDLRVAVPETEAWVDDVMRRLGWHDRERVYLVLLASLHGLRDSLPQRMRRYTSERNCRHCCAGSIMRDGIQAPTRQRGAEAPFLSVFTMASIATPASMWRRPLAWCSPHLRHVCLPANSRTPRPPRRSRSTISGQADLAMSVTARSTDPRPPRSVRLFLCGDVMTGRGIDQMLPHPCDPTLHESYAASAKDYVGLAEQANGPIPRHAEPSYVWGAARDELSRMQPDAHIINLETAITRSSS